MNHTYDFMKFEAVIKAIATSYLTMLEDWYFELLKDMNKI